MAASPTVRRTGLRNLDERVSSVVIAGVRIVVGLLWLANMEWKRPPDFGLNLKNGLYKYIDSAVRLPVFPPYSKFVENVVLPNYTFFGWMTLLMEATLCALLLLGLWTRLAALGGAVLSLTIAWSVLHYDKVYEWPWSYWLMIAIHLLLAAVHAGDHYGIDGVHRGYGTRRLAGTVLGAVAVVVGLAGLVVARTVDFTDKQGALLGWASGEMKYLWFNGLGAVVTIAVGAFTIVAFRAGAKALQWAAAGLFGLMALQVIVQWRYNDGRWTGGIFGGTGANLAFWLALALGIASLNIGPLGALVSRRRARGTTD
jgi:uncharacterized membrane protein YphA (DoxX/SURF4 family)